MKLPLLLLQPRPHTECWLRSVLSAAHTHSTTVTTQPEDTKDKDRSKPPKAQSYNSRITLKPGPRTPNTHAWSLSTQPPTSLSKDGNKWSSVDCIPAWTWTSPPRKKAWCCLPQSSSPGKRADSGHSGNPKRSTWGKRSNRGSLKTLSLTLPRVLAVTSTLKDCNRTRVSMVFLNSVSSVSFRILSQCSSGKFAYDFLSLSSP